MFFQYNQNNTGGSFIVDEAVGHTVIIEAHDADAANEIAQVSGIYFDGCNDGGGDCPCCGDRWYRIHGESGDPEPMIYGKPVSTSQFDSFFRKTARVYFLDGRQENYELRDPAPHPKGWLKPVSKRIITKQLH